jgi:hypothetical protein
MRTLVCALRAPSPPRSGDDLRCWQTVNVLAEYCETGLFALAGPSSPDQNPAAVWQVASRPPAQNGNQDLSWMTRAGGLPSDAGRKLSSWNTCGCIRMKPWLAPPARD